MWVASPMDDATLHSPFAPPGETPRWGRLYGSSLALCMASFQGGPLLAITPDIPGARRLEQALRFYAPQREVLVFPDRETLPYDVFSPHPDITSQRLEVLHRLPRLEEGFIIAPIATLLHRLPPRSYLERHSFLLEEGEGQSLLELRSRLDESGYRNVAEVTAPGEYAVRGGILDLFPMGARLPYRIEFFDEAIESIRTFDPETQRSIAQMHRMQMLPAREFPLDEAGITTFRQRWRAAFAGDPLKSPLYREVSEGFAPQGIEYYLPLFFPELGTFFDYLPKTTRCLVLEGVEEAAQRFLEEVEERFEQRRHDRERPVLAPQKVFLQGSWREALGSLPCTEVQTLPSGETDFCTALPPALPVQTHAQRPLELLERFLKDFPGRVLLVAESTGRREALLDLLKGHALHPQIFSDWPAFLQSGASLGLTTAPLEEGLYLEHPPLAVITEAQLFGKRVLQQRRRERSRRSPEHLLRDLTELSPGAPVVHEEHGVGRYRGMEVLETQGLREEFLVLEYAEGGRLYVPVTDFHLIRRYTGGESAPLHKLGSGQWERAKRKAQEKARDVAAELLEVYARRASRPGKAFKVEPALYRDFIQGFPFEETPDQAQAIEEVMEAMAQETPMDHLVCGDVGFGKTEVALRSAFIAVQAGHQVAVLAPTTLLAQQHFETFQDRFADWPVRIGLLSRFRSKKQQRETLKALAEGHIDIIIGTHRLLSEDVRFKRLGLVIIDEEHRFGVRHKERIKALRAEVDILTLTATPIPRTLNMAFSKLRGLSIISTPPETRLAIKTFVRTWDNSLIREGILRELLRGGQVYFLHNEVETIEKMAERIRTLVPEAEVRIAHGQMRERELEGVMQDFYHGRFNVLVCTTIIESGLDVPNANTLFIHRADRFGLAQLHQLRGRVGRSHHQAYAYLLTPPPSALTADAKRRLEAIASLEDLGVGFMLATHDLEIRGAGELLGEEQSGHIHAVGFSLYMDYLERAVAALRSGELPKEPPKDTEVHLKVPALIPEDYLPDIQARLVMYKRIASAPSEEALRELQVEMIDRYGLLPEPTKHLFRLTALKLRARPLGIRRIDLGERGGRILFHPSPNIDPLRIIELVQQKPEHFRLKGQDALALTLELPDDAARFDFLENLLEALCTPRQDGRAIA